MYMSNSSYFFLCFVVDCCILNSQKDTNTCCILMFNRFDWVGGRLNDGRAEDRIIRRRMNVYNTEVVRAEGM